MFKQPFVTVEDARRAAKCRLPAMVFDYIDGAAGEGLAEERNRRELAQLMLRSRVLQNVEKRSVAGRLFGAATKLPFGIAPMGMCNLSGPGTDIHLAQFAAQNHVPVAVSTAASTPLEKMIEAAEGNAWFQLYYTADQSAAEHLLSRAETAGYDVLVLTVDVPEVGKRPRELRHGFKMPFKIGPRQFLDFAMHPKWSVSTLLYGAPSLANFDGSQASFDRSASRAGADWTYLKQLRQRWKGKLVIKGVLDVEDALRLKGEGVDAIQVSSHGGRQLDSAIPPILALKAIREALGEEFTLFYDSGIRTGEDIVKAYAMGADFVFLGRPFQMAIAGYGAGGAQKLGTLLGDEVSQTLAMLGITSIDQISNGMISERSCVMHQVGS
jgi:L-lactate dehydrogenase (cytochrome)